MADKKKRILAAVFFFFLLSLTSRKIVLAAGSYTVEQGAFVYTNEDTGYQIYLSDEEDLLSSDEEKDLIEAMKPVTVYGNAAFISAYSSGTTAQSLAFDAYDALFSKASGTLFLIDMDDRKLWIESDGAIYEKITTEKANTITDNIYRYASDGDYAVCVITGFEQIVRVLENKPIPQSMKYICNMFLAMILALMLNFVFAYLSRVRNKVTQSALLGAMEYHFSVSNLKSKKVSSHKTYAPRSSGSDGGSGSSHSGGGGGGGHSGGGGGHGF